jgi:hypothetical protein
MRTIIHAFIVGFVSTGCAHHGATSSAALERRCAPILDEILQVQDLRTINNSALRHKRSEGTLTNDDIESWRTVEDELGSRAAHLYKIADRRKCFTGLEKMFLTFS